MAKGDLELMRFFNTRGKAYKALDLKERSKTLSEEALLDILASDGMLHKRPVLVGEDFVLLGFNETNWEDKVLKEF